MSELQYLAFEEEGQIYQVEMTTKSVPQNVDNLFDEERGVGQEVLNRMQQTTQLIRGYAKGVVKAFQDFGVAEVEEINLHFGIKLGGGAGIPYITSGTAESHLDIQVKCKFPSRKSEPTQET